MIKAVVDASAFVRLYIPDGPLPEGLIEIIKKALKVESVLLAPDLMLAEASQVVLKKINRAELDKRIGEKIISSMQSIPFQYISNSILLNKSFALSLSNDISIYDSLYVSLALKAEALLFTCDEQMRKIYEKIKER